MSKEPQYDTFSEIRDALREVNQGDQLLIRALGRDEEGGDIVYEDQGSVLNIEEGGDLVFKDPSTPAGRVIRPDKALVYEYNHDEETEEHRPLESPLQIVGLWVYPKNSEE